MNVFEIEQLRRKLLELHSESASSLKKLFSFYKYFDLILSSNNNSIIEVYLHEFIEDYCDAICKIDPFGFNPYFIEELLEQIETLKNHQQFMADSEIFQRCEEKLSSAHEVIMSILRGEPTQQHLSARTYFPLIDKEAKENIFVVIESVTIKIAKGDKENKFILVPSEKEIEEKLSAQIRTSWFTALSETKRFVRKTFPFHEVLIHFNKAEGFYEGNSLGLAITLSFIEELLKFYNPTYSITIKELTAFTGAIDEAGRVSNTGSEIIQAKTAGIFFSPIQTFIIPKEDEDEAKKRLSQLRGTYPNRNVKLIAVEELNDVLNRRDIAEIKKVSPIVRTGRFAKQNWGSAVASIILTALLALLFVLDFDENPVAVRADGSFLHILNKNGKVLWNVPFTISKSWMPYFEPKQQIMFVDVDGDKINEILTGDDFNRAYSGINDHKIALRNSEGRVIWTYTFEDQAFTKREEITRNYNHYLIDTLTIENKTYIFCKAENNESFPCALFGINLQNGKRFEKTHWVTGRFSSVVFKDLNADGKIEIIGLGLDNGYEDLILWALEFDEMNGTRLTTKDYAIQNKRETKFLFYLRFPKIDLDLFFNQRFPSAFSPELIINETKGYIEFGTHFYKNGNENEAIILGQLQYHYYYLKDSVEVFITNNFRITRDSLVAKGFLNPPFTDTREYRKILKDAVLYWDGRKFVHHWEKK